MNNSDRCDGESGDVDSGDGFEPGPEGRDRAIKMTVEGARQAFLVNQLQLSELEERLDKQKLGRFMRDFMAPYGQELKEAKVFGNISSIDLVRFLDGIEQLDLNLNTVADLREHFAAYDEKQGGRTFWEMDREAFLGFIDYIERQGDDLGYSIVEVLQMAAVARSKLEALTTAFVDFAIEADRAGVVLGEDEDEDDDEESW